MTLNEQLTRLRRLSEEPPREAMTRSERMPTMAAQHIRSKEYERELRAGLREALALVETLTTTSEPPAADPRLIRFYPRGTP